MKTWDDREILVFDDDAPPMRAEAPAGLRYRLIPGTSADRRSILLRIKLGADGAEESTTDVRMNEHQTKALGHLLKKKLAATSGKASAVVSYGDLAEAAEIMVTSSDYREVQSLIKDVRAQLYDNPKKTDGAVGKPRTDEKALIRTWQREGYYFNRKVRTEVQSETQKTLSGAKGRAINGFFGDEAPNDPKAPRGVIILPADTIDKMVLGWVPDQVRPTRGTDRPFKARRWINACDTEGARAILDIFETQGSCVPRLVFSYVNIADDLGSAPFEITMGGQAGKTNEELDRIGAGWMKVRVADDSGDTLFLHEKLVSSRDLKKDAPGGDGLCRILPDEWDERYMERWAAKMREPHLPAVREYAMILRFTELLEPEGQMARRKVHFFLIGFTEIGTAAAGHYLARRWSALWEEHVGQQLDGPTRGDFLALIAGPSDMLRLESWKRVEFITPEKVAALFSREERDKLTSPWLERVMSVDEEANG